ncbi:MAG: two-component sensor histidine kinase [Candidatus Symbiothrix sp.]|jgi:signal transduction histidine kinase|nr:two-component sensor histidine kinase [Candidatus Symbiothrix sp.]
MHLNYKQKLFLYFLLIFTAFTVCVIFFEQSREKEHKTQALEEKLDVYATLVDKMIRQHPGESPLPSGLDGLLPENIRLTLINRQGTVLYDNAIREPVQMENHARRPEIIDAWKKGKGSNIRVSSSNDKEYLYYAKQFDNRYIRVALPYDIQTRRFLKPDNLFLYYIIALFLLMLILINWVAGRFGKSIKRLRNFTTAIEQGNLQAHKIKFPDDELGKIGTKMVENYRYLRESKREIALEREKLLQHVHSSEEGLCFFSADRSVEFYNGLFVKYLNIIVSEANGHPSAALTDAAFDKITRFISNRDHQENYFETQINKQGKNFAVRLNIFDDKSFEIIINDITRQEKTRRLKQEMTGNITHELRTPVTGIRGCLETILEHPLDPEKKQYFIENAYNQVLSLSELIQDMSLITKMEEAPQSFKQESVSIGHLLENLKRDLEIPLNEKKIRMEWKMENVTVRGNRNLLYSIFRNLTDNVIRYAGHNVLITISKYNEDRNFYYFSYSDTGVGISGEQHLNRLFERFYRISEGRTRDTGGSGLGLSIVKNAVSFHKGTIVAKNRPGGGLEFLFQLRKE